MVRLRALRPPHVRHHVLRKCIRWVRIPKSIVVPWTRQTTRMCWALPSGAAAHMWADIPAARLPKVVESRRFEYRKHRMRGQGWTVVFATVGREGGRACGWRGARAGLLESGSHVRGQVIVRVVVRVVGCVACLAVEIGHVRDIAQGRQGQIPFAGRRCSCHSRSHGCGVRETPNFGVGSAVLSRIARSKGRCSRGSCLFHCARMLVLVTG